MYQLKAFMSIPALADNTPGVTGRLVNCLPMPLRSHARSVTGCVELHQT